MGLSVAHITTIDMSLHLLLLNQLRSLRQAGYEVVGISSPGPHVDAIAAAGIRHIPVVISRSISPLQDLISLWKLYRILHRGRFAIVHTHTPKAGFLGQFAARLAGVPVVVNTVHGYPFHDHMSPAKRRFFVLLEQIAARWSDLILSQSREDIQTAIRQHICPPEKIQYLGNGIDTAYFDRTSIDEKLVDHMRREMGLAGKRVVGFVGRLVEEKGIPELLRAAAYVLDRVPSARFLLVGPTDTGKPDAVSPEDVDDPRVAQACVFTGMRQDLPALYKLMDVFVLPSHREGFPRAPMEASAMMVPCVVTDTRGCRETVEHGRNGLLVPVGNAHALADAIIEILTDPLKAQRMGNVGRRMALERFDERIVFEKVKAAYARLLEEKGLSLPPSTQPATRDC